MAPPPTSGGSSGGGRDGDLNERVARIEATMAHLATKRDLVEIKIWVLGGVLAGMFGVFLVMLSFWLIGSK